MQDGGVHMSRTDLGQSGRRRQVVAPSSEDIRILSVNMTLSYSEDLFAKPGG